MQAPHITVRTVFYLLLIFIHVVGNTRTHLFRDTLVNNVSARHRSSCILQHPIEGTFCTHDRDERHFKWFVGAHQCQFRFIHVSVFVCRLNAAIPIVLRYLWKTFHHVTHRIHTSELLEGEQIHASAFGFHDTMSHRCILWSQWSWLIVIVDEIRHGSIFTTISRAMHPIVNHIVDEVKHASPSDRWISSRVVCPEIAHKRCVLSSDGRTKRVVPCVESLGGYGVLNRYVHRGFLTFVFPVSQVKHVAIERDILIQSPFA